MAERLTTKGCLYPERSGGSRFDPWVDRYIFSLPHTTHLGGAIDDLALFVFR